MKIKQAAGIAILTLFFILIASSLHAEEKKTDLQWVKWEDKPRPTLPVSASAASEPEVQKPAQVPIPEALPNYRRPADAPPLPDEEEAVEENGAVLAEEPAEKPAAAAAMPAEEQKKIEAEIPPAPETAEEEIAEPAAAQAPPAPAALEEKIPAPVPPAEEETAPAPAPQAIDENRVIASDVQAEAEAEQEAEVLPEEIPSADPQKNADQNESGFALEVVDHGAAAAEETDADVTGETPDATDGTDWLDETKDNPAPADETPEALPAAEKEAAPAPTAEQIKKANDLLKQKFSS